MREFPVTPPPLVAWEWIRARTELRQDQGEGSRKAKTVESGLSQGYQDRRAGSATQPREEILRPSSRPRLEDKRSDTQIYIGARPCAQCYS